MNEFLTTATGKLLDFGEKVAEFLLRISEDANADELLEKLSSATSSLPEELRGKLEDGLTESVVIDFIRRLGDEADEIKTELDKYLLTIEQLDDEGAVWSKAASDDLQLAPSGSVTMTVGGSGSVAAGIFKPGPYYEIEGKLQASGGLKAPFSFGSLGIHGSTKGEATLRVKFAHGGSTRLIEAIVADVVTLGQLSDPGHLAQADDFESYELSTAGEISLGAKLEIGKVWSTSHIRDSTSSVTTEVNAKAGVSVEWLRQGAFTLNVSRIAGNKLSIKVVDEDLLRRSTAFSLGAEVDVSGIEKATRSIMEQVAAFPNPVETLVNKYSRPSALVANKIDEVIAESQAEVTELVEVILGREDADQLVADIRNSLVAAVEKRAELVTSLMAGEVRDLLKHLMNQFDELDAEQREDVEEFLTQKLTDLVGKVNDDVVEAVRKLIEKEATRLELTQALNDIGEAVEGAFVSLDQQARKLLDPVKKLLERYRRLESSVNNAIKAVEEEKLTIAFSHTISNSTTQNHLLAFEINGFGRSTRHAFRAMLAGDFRPALTSSSRQIKLTDSIYAAALKRKAATSLNVHVFGHDFSWSKVLTSDIEVRTNGTTIEVLAGVGSAEEEVSFGGESHRLRFQTLANFIDQNAPSTLTAVYRKEETDIDALTSYVSSMEKMALVPVGASQRMLSRELVKALANDRTVTVTTSLGLSSQQIQRMASWVREHQVEFHAMALDYQIQALCQIPVYAEAVGHLQDRIVSGNLVSLIYKHRNSNSRDVKAFVGGHPDLMDPGLLRQAAVISNSNDNAEATIHFLSRWEALVNANLPAVGSDGKVNAQGLKDLQRRNKKMIRAIDEWVDVKLADLFRAGMSPNTLSLFATFKELASMADPDTTVVLVPLVSWQEEDHQKKHVAIV